MSKFSAILLGTLVVLALGTAVAVEAATQYDAVLEWNGPYFRAINNSSIDQLVDDPVVNTPFVQPFAVASREHAAAGRDVVYVVDSGNNRVQAFEANATYTSVAHTALSYQAGGVAAASQWDTDQIYLAEWAAASNKWIVPYSQVVVIDGVTWTYVASVSGFVAADKVYTIDFDDATNAPEIVFPASSLASTSKISVKYLVSDDQTGATAAFGIGEIDYGTGNGATPVLTEINEASGGPSSWELVKSIAIVQDEVTATTDNVFLVDAADGSAGQDEELFQYAVTVAGAVSYVESYDDVLNTPGDVAVARSGASTVGTVTLNNDTGPFDQGTAALLDASQVTGHTYSVTVGGGNVTITDATTGRVLLNAGSFAAMNDPYDGIPGLTLPLNGAAGGAQTITTVKSIPGRYLFVADTGNNRIKVIDAADGAGFAGDWLPGDVRTSDDQETATIGANNALDVRQSTPASVPENWRGWTAAAPIKEGTLATITFDPAGTPVTWTRINDLSTATPSSNVYVVDWRTGMITFGDGIHGAIPPASTAFEYTYTTTPDVLRYGSAGVGNGRFSAPKGVAARYNSNIAAYDVYVADTGNNRIQKFNFFPGDAALNIPARMQYVTQWSSASNSADKLSGPVDIYVQADGATPNVVYLAVSDQGNDRIVVYRDTAAMGAGGFSAPIYDASFGVQGNALGKYAELSGISFVQNGNDLDIYAADALRGTVTKYEEAPTPSIVLTFTGGSTLPACFPPTGSYPFTFAVTNPPTGGWVDFYFSPSATFDPTTAKLCFTAGSISASATSATWTFSSSPDGAPATSLGGYYLHALVKDSTGSTVASTVSTSGQLLCIDPTLLPSLSLIDEIDGDAVLSIQNGAERDISLNVSYPDSVASVGYSGSFDASQLEITGITPGNAWDGTGATAVLFTTDWDNVAGTFQVNSSGLGTPSGLTGNGPYVIAHIHIATRGNALITSTPTKASTFAVSAPGSSMQDIHGLAPSQWRAKSLAVKAAYLGDLATSGAGADSTVPHLRVNPDGKINFEDQMIFTLGWNGDVNNVQDRIADIGPTAGSAPDIVSVPDAQWNVDDVLAFTTMYSWASVAGFTRPGSGNEFAVAHVAGVRPAPLGVDVAGKGHVYTVSHVDNPLPGSTFTVDLVADGDKLTGALVSLGFDPKQVEPIEVRSGDFFRGNDGNLFFQRGGDNWLEISTSRLDRAAPSVSGSGLLAQVTFRILGSATADFDLHYDLRATGNKVAARGNAKTGPLSGAASEFALFANYPNPASGPTNIVYSLPQSAKVSLDVYDAGGRLVKNLVKGEVASGYHVVAFDGKNRNLELLPAGVYFYQLRAGEQTTTRKMIVTR